MRSLNVYGFLLTCCFLLILFTIAPFTMGNSERTSRRTRSAEQEKDGKAKKKLVLNEWNFFRCEVRSDL